MGQAFADAAEAIQGQAEVTPEVAIESVDPGRDDQEGWREPDDGLQGLVEGCEILVVGGAGRQGEIAVAVDSETGACFSGAPPIEGVVVVRIGVQGDEEHLVGGVEDILGAVAVVEVDVEDGHLAALAQVGGGDGRIVQIAVSAAGVGAGVVTGRAAEGIGCGSAVEQQVRGGEGTAGGGKGRGEGGLDDRGGVEAVVAGLIDPGFGAVGLVAQGEGDGDDAFCRLAGGNPGGIHGLQVVDVVAVVGGKQGVDGVIARWSDIGEAGGSQAHEDRFGAIRRLGVGDRATAGEFVDRGVPEMFLGVDDFHGVPSHSSASRP